MAKLTAIELLRSVLLGEHQEDLPRNSVQVAQAQANTPNPMNKPSQHQTTDDTPSPAYISDDEDKDLPQPRHSPRIEQQKRTHAGMPNPIAALAANETVTVPDLIIHQHRHYTSKYSAANKHLQMSEWTWSTYFANSIIDDKTGEALEYRNLIKLDKYCSTWFTSPANEIGRLAQGIRDIKGTNTIFFILKSEISKDRLWDLTYGRIVCTYRPQKKEPNRARLTVGGDRINYPWDVSTPTAELPTIKLHWNSTISTKGARYVKLDVVNFYLGTPMDRPEYMCLPLKIIPDEIIEKYNLREIQSDGWVYCKIVRGMYGLPHAGLIANKLLKRRLAKHGYYECQFTQGLWRHAWRPIMFTLVVDDFGAKYKGLNNANHLLKALEEYYDVSVDWKGELYAGIKLNWNYDKGYVDTHVPGFVEKELHKYQHKPPSKSQHAPAKATPIQYGAKVQTTNVDTSPTLSAQRI